jgi:hypothetical protein
MKRRILAIVLISGAILTSSGAAQRPRRVTADMILEGEWTCFLEMRTTRRRDAFQGEYDAPCHQCGSGYTFSFKHDGTFSRYLPGWGPFSGRTESGHWRMMHEPYVVLMPDGQQPSPRMRVTSATLDTVVLDAAPHNERYTCTRYTPPPIPDAPPADAPAPRNGNVVDFSGLR